MKIQKDFFYYLSILIYILCLFFPITCVFGRLGRGQEYPYLLKGYWLLFVFGILLLLMFGELFWVRADIIGKMARHRKLGLILEIMTVCIVVITGACLRFVMIESMPVEQASDYKTYYEMAVMINEGTLQEKGVWHCNYVAMFPHVYGYPAVLAKVFDLFGKSVRKALIFNFVVSIASMFLVWIISRMLSNRFGGLAALLLWSFMPSVILYSNIVGSEPLFTLILLFAVFLFALSLKERTNQRKNYWVCTIELVLLGITLAFASFIRPMGMIFLIAAIICMLSIEEKKSDITGKDIPLGIRLTKSGWRRCLILLSVYLICSRLFTISTSSAVNRELAGSSVSFGYNLMVGLNLESNGRYNQNDTDFLFNSFYDSGSAHEAQKLSLRWLFSVLKLTFDRSLISL